MVEKRKTISGESSNVKKLGWGELEATCNAILSSLSVILIWLTNKLI